MAAGQADQYLNLDQAVASYRRQAIIAIQSAFLLGASILFFQSAVNAEIFYSILVSALLSAASIALVVKGRPKVAALILAGQFLVLPTYLALSALGTFDSVILIFPAGMMAISVVAKPRETAVFSMVTLACVCGVAFATMNHLIGNQTIATAMGGETLDIVTTVVVTGFCGMVATYVSSTLTGLLRVLADHQATLEESIARRTKELALSNDELRAAVAHLDLARVELVRGEKLAGLGSLVAGIAHELNTPIGNTTVAATTMQHHLLEFKRLMEGGAVRKADLQAFIQNCADGADLLVRSTQRAHDLVSSFKQVAVDQASERRREYDPAEVIDDVLRSLLPSFKGKGIKVVGNVDPGILCDGYPGPLGQIISNLVQNAIVHGFEGAAHGQVRVSGARVEDGKMRIQVHDNGRGIEPHNIEKIFDPFFTTRLGQGGSGLGLTIVHNLATVVLGGKVEVRSQVGEGTCFTLILPCIAPLEPCDPEGP